MTAAKELRNVLMPVLWIAGFALLAALPLAFRAAGVAYLTDALVRTVIVAIAAIGLNFLVFTAGLVSFGHAAYFGIGAYAVGISDYYGYSNGFFHVAVALSVSGVFALVTGVLALRTRGAHFIMITLAFSQVIYYIMLGLKEYGGDDGLVINNNSAFPLIDLGDKLSLYWVSLVVLTMQVAFFAALNRARFGLVLAAAKGSERRVRSSGLNVYGYRLVAYVIAGMLSSLAGVLLANLTTFVTPDRMNWIHSGELLFMITLGGMGTALSPLTGAALFVFLEEFLSAITIYWHFWFGAFLVAVVMIGAARLRRFTSSFFGVVQR
jgi:branched-chain amino acid transport system permease protein